MESHIRNGSSKIYSEVLPNDNLNPYAQCLEILWEVRIWCNEWEHQHHPVQLCILHIGIFFAVVKTIIFMLYQMYPRTAYYHHSTQFLGF